MINIGLFANFGHQYFFSGLVAREEETSIRTSTGQSDESSRGSTIAVTDYHNLRLADPDDLGPAQPLLTDNQLRTLLLRARNDPWRAADGAPFVRYRLGIKNFVAKDGTVYGIFGIWFAVETNVGPDTRGYVIDVQDGPQAAAPVAAQSAPPYAAKSPGGLPAQHAFVAATFGAELDSRIPPDYRTLDIAWMKPGGRPLEVDLIVDFGNSRTTVFALEHRKNSMEDVSEFPLICRPVGFTLMHDGVRELPVHQRREADPYLIDSWFVFHETSFSALEKPKNAGMREVVNETVKAGKFPWSKEVTKPKRAITRKPHAFIEMSPTVMGPWAKQLLSQSSQPASDTARPVSGRLFLSSPKRYAWDSEQSVGEGTYWTMMLNPWTEHDYRRSLPPLQGEVLRFVYADDRPWDIQTPPTGNDKPHHRPVVDPDQPFHARGCTMTLAALAIIENAYRQITSDEWRRGYKEMLPRALRAIQVTYPSGWTADEIARYRQKWQNAINIFSHTRLPLGPDGKSTENDNPVPQLKMSIDEAVAAQLPIVYTQIRNLQNVADTWTRLYGHAVGDNKHAVRVMSVDIGGGTTDTSIVEYRSASGPGVLNVNLKAKLLFKDSSTTAGDQLVKSMIETALLPELGQRLLAQGSGQELKQKFRNLFIGVGESDREREDRAIIARLVFMPLVVKWLQDISAGRRGPAGRSGFWSMNEAGCDGYAIKKLQKLLERNSIPIETEIDASGFFHVNYETLEKTIGEVFQSMVSLHAQLVGAYNCDLVILTGKVSELPQIKLLFEQQLPLTANRIISAKGYDTQTWFPLTDTSGIPDAKLVTAVGTALARAIERGSVQQWEKIDFETAYEQRYCWGLMPPDAGPFNARHLLIADQEEFDIKDGNLIITSRKTPDSADCVLSTDNTYIGRHLFRMSDSHPEQVYHFRRKRAPDAKNASDAQYKVKVRLRREKDRDSETFGVAERLVIEDVLEGEDENGKPLGYHDVELRLCTLSGRTHWLDNGQFNMRWDVP